jgi:hypothetical protein
MTYFVAALLLLVSIFIPGGPGWCVWGLGVGLMGYDMVQGLRRRKRP